MKNSDDIINWNGTTYFKPRGLADHVAKRIANGGMERYKESSRRWELCPIELAQSIEDSGFYASDSYGENMRIFKRVNARGKLNADYKEVTQKTLHISYGSEPHLKLVECPTDDEEYIGNESFGNKSLGFELTLSKLKKIIREGYSVNPPVSLPSDTDDFLDGMGEKVPHIESEIVKKSVSESYKDTALYKALHDHHYMEKGEDLPSSLPTPPTDEANREENLKVYYEANRENLNAKKKAYKKAHDSTKGVHWFPPQPKEAKIEVVKHYFKTNKEARDKAPKEVITSLFSLQEIGDMYFDDRES
jgi:hypothetical protein